MSDLPLKVLVLSSHPLFGQSIVHVLRESDGIQLTSMCYEALSEAPGTLHDVALCVFPPGIWPDEVRSRVHDVSERTGSAPIACFFLSSDDSILSAAVNAGATGLIEDTLLGGTIEANAISACLERVAQGEFVASHPVALRLARLQSSAARDCLLSSKSNQLTRREHQVLDLLAKGKSNREIANDLSVSEHTIRSHLRGVMHKLQVNSRMQAAASVWRGQVTTLLGEEYTNGDSSSRR